MNRILLTLSYIFGLVPLNRLKGNTNAFTDYFLMICVPLCYYLSYGLALFGGFAVYQLPNCGDICSFTNRLLMQMGIFLYTSNWLVSLYRRKRFFMLFKRSLNEIDDNINACCRTLISYVKAPSNRKLYYSIWTGVVLLFGAVLLFESVEMMMYYGRYFFVANMAVTFPFFTGAIIQGQFIHYVSLISERFAELHNMFSTINQECQRQKRSTTTFNTRTNVKAFQTGNPSFVHLRRRHKQDWEMDSSDDSEEFDAEADAGETDYMASEANLSMLFKLHEQILSLCVLTNSSFAPQCVSYMAVCFTIIIYDILFNTKVVYIARGKNPLLDYVAMSCIFWSVLLTLVAYLDLRACSKANGYSRKIVMIVHEITQKNTMFLLSSDFYYNMMKSFSLQFLHWEEYFQFNGIGLFILDYTFIFSVVGIATSNLIVLLQFDMNTYLKAEGLI